MLCLPLEPGAPLKMADNGQGPCANCERQIQYRPEVADSTSTLMCPACAIAFMQAE
jgi:hypothetical protein